MMEKCYDEGTLQAFLDNELPSELSQAVARHIVDCDPCAEMLAEVEEETAFAFTALEQEFNTLVPTQRLWTKINESIEVQNRQRTLWQRLTGFVAGISLLNPQVMAFGSLLMIVGVVSALIVLKSNSVSDKDNLAVVKPSVTNVAQTKSETTAPVVVNPSVPDKETETVNVVKPKLQNSSEFRVERASLSEPERRSNRKNESEPPVYVPKPAVYKYLDGEESYVTTIARLEKTVDDSKDEVLNPSARFSYEKDMAVVNDTIEKMREKVKKNPKNEDAKQILFSSYQNKIELLNSVNQRGELMASLR